MTENSLENTAKNPALGNPAAEVISPRELPKKTPLKISLVPTSEVPRVWDLVSHMLKRATDLSQGRYGLRDLKAKILSGEFELWIIFDEAGEIVASVTTTMTAYPQVKMVSGQFLGGDRLADWRDDFCAKLESWAKDNGCASIELTGRAGWSKVLDGNGYREVFRVYQRNLK